ncbi:MAG: HAMP domain-containing sensor histidine kinase [Bacteroidota bacterium]
MPNAATINFTKDVRLDVIQSDELRLEIIFKNVISNAIKYCDPGKGEKFISISTYQDDHAAIVKIEDNGIGIDKNYLHRIFDMFFVTDHNQNGSGLGFTSPKKQSASSMEPLKLNLKKGLAASLRLVSRVKIS